MIQEAPPSVRGFFVAMKGPVLAESRHQATKSMSIADNSPISSKQAPATSQKMAGPNHGPAFCFREIVGFDVTHDGATNDD